MRTLIVGAGATGGYFGGRLLQAGRDVTFLVRPARRELLARQGLVIESPLGNVHIEAPPTVLADGLTPAFDLVLLSCKAYDLDSAIASFAPAVGPATAILPLLNGLRHIARLRETFGDAAVLGGQCVISSMLRDNGTIAHLNSVHSLTYGELDGTRSPLIADIEREFADLFEAKASAAILQEMWDKWVLLASMAGVTSLMRAPIGAIVAAPGGRDFILSVIDECRAVARAEDHEPSDGVMDHMRAFLTTEGAPQTSSMYRDISAGGRIEADHIIGDMIARADAASIAVPHLRVIYAHLKAYEAQLTA